MRFSFLQLICLWAILGLSLVACQRSAAGAETRQTVAVAPSATKPASPVVAPTQAPALSIQPSRTPDHPRLTLPFTASPLVAQSTARPARAVCSPLADHSLEELSAIVSDPYHPPPIGKDDRHQGVDFSYYRQDGRATIQGEGVQAVLSGRVAASIHDSFPFGNLVIVESAKEDLPDDLLQKLKLGPAQSLYLLYAHLEAPPLVGSSDAVQACQSLGAVGKSGNAGVAHLHLETRIGPAGTLFSGMAYYTPQASPQERENYVLWRMSGVFQHFDPMILLAR
jgi:murein DD-endopeptidase MepM/ murein hydrolase activator NlpD